DEDFTAASARAADLEVELRAHSKVLVRGPMPCPLSRIAGKHRIAIELTASRASELQAALTGLRNRGLAKSDEATAVDVDPVALLWRSGRASAGRSRISTRSMSVLRGCAATQFAKYACATVAPGGHSLMRRVRSGVSSATNGPSTVMTDRSSSSIAPNGMK